MSGAPDSGNGPPPDSKPEIVWPIPGIKDPHHPYLLAGRSVVEGSPPPLPAAEMVRLVCWVGWERRGKDGDWVSRAHHSCVGTAFGMLAEVVLAAYRKVGTSMKPDPNLFQCPLAALQVRMVNGFINLHDKFQLLLSFS